FLVIPRILQQRFDVLLHGPRSAQFAQGGELEPQTTSLRLLAGPGARRRVREPEKSPPVLEVQLGMPPVMDDGARVPPEWRLPGRSAHTKGRLSPQHGQTAAPRLPDGGQIRLDDEKGLAATQQLQRLPGPGLEARTADNLDAF